MKSFEEEFPSLKDNKLFYECVDEYVVQIPDIKEHCLDKQKVREAIAKIEGYTMTREAIPTHVKAMQDLKKELFGDEYEDN